MAKMMLKKMQMITLTKRITTTTTITKLSGFVRQPGIAHSLNLMMIDGEDDVEDNADGNNNNNNNNNNSNNNKNNKAVSGFAGQPGAAHPQT